MTAWDDIIVAGLSHQGMIRKDNQDSYGFIDPKSPALLRERGRLFIVADGLGGHRGGSVASRMAVDIIGKIYYSTAEQPVYPALLKALETANHSIFEASGQHEELQGMATTCTALVLKEQEMFMAHVGDSRAYLIRDEMIKQLSTDHTLVEEMVNSGIINHEEAKSHPDSHILTRSLGILQAVEVDILDPPFQLASGDSLLLCSDGLTAYLDDNEIRYAVTEYPPAQACETMIETANQRGGRDNITIEIVHMKSGDEKYPHVPTGGEPTIGHTEKLLGRTVPFPKAESREAAEGEKVEIYWAGLFYALYLLFIFVYFFFYFGK